MNAAHKNECRGGARQVVKTLSKYATDFIAIATRYATVSNGLDLVLLVLCVMFVAMFGGMLK